MPEDGWLKNEPVTWHEVNRALQDIDILMQYLGELPDARLLSYFTDTQLQLAEGAARRSIPPCDSYALFLDRLNQISAAFQTGRAALLPPEADMRGKEIRCSAVAFVYWSRDFLSAVAAPTTADSIQLTRDYLTHKMRWPSLSAWKPAPVASSKPSIPALPPDLDAPTRDRLARKLAGRVRRYEWGTITAVVLTLVVSIYALSGRLILNNEKAMRDTWAKVDAEVEAEEVKVFKTPTLPLDSKAPEHFDVIGLCELTEIEVRPSPSQIADSGQVRADVSSTASSVVRPERVRAYVMPRQAHLCADREKALYDLFLVSTHLQTWDGIVTRHLGYFFGVVPGTLYSFAATDSNCFGLHPEREKASNCRETLSDNIDRSRHVAESVLGGLTQYVLPVLYGFLGAMAGTLRLVRRKVEGFLLSYTDRARVQQGAILGVLCGAVIGLFATYVGGGSEPGNVGISALAMLAGYNVDGVFRFLDELWDRLFRPATPAKPG